MCQASPIAIAFFVHVVYADLYTCFSALFSPSWRNLRLCGYRWRNCVSCPTYDVRLSTQTSYSHSGLTVASRLAENKSVTVAVIEAGPNAENLPEVDSSKTSQL